MTRILVVEDDDRLSAVLAKNLAARTYTSDVAASAEEALALLIEQPADLMVIDLGLPGMSGLELIEQVRLRYDMPIIVMSARHADSDKIAALDAGADDYVSKPTSMGELFARIRATLRRSDPAAVARLVVTPDFTIDLVRREVTRDGEPLRLTRLEWGILETLVRSGGRLVTHRQLLQSVWGPDYGSETNYLRVHLTHLRRKLEPVPAQPRYLITEPAVGYRFRMPAD